MPDGAIKPQQAPDRADLPPPSDFGVTLDPLALEYAHDSEMLAEAYGGSGIKALFRNWIALMCSLCACTGGLLFGFVRLSLPPNFC